LRTKPLTSLGLIGGAVVFGMVLAGGLEWTPSSLASPVAASAEVVGGAAAASLRGLPSFADLAEAVLPAVVTIDATTIEKADARRRGAREGVNPFEFFLGPQGPQGPRGREGQGGPRAPQEFRSDSAGTGFVISRDGLIVTNNHVVDGATNLTVRLGDREYPAEVKGTDPATDLALLKVEAGRDLKYLALGDSDRLRVGDWVVVVGSPLHLDGSVTVGVVSAKNRSIGINESAFENYIQTDAAINRGNSGGPLVDLEGRVVGIATAMNWGAENIAFAVPVNLLRDILPQLRDKGRVSRGYLGVNVQNLTYERSQAFGLQNTDGALVVSVEADTPAGRAGVEHGDIILSVDDRTIKTTRDLIGYVSGRGPDASVRLRILRDGKEIERRVQLGERPGRDAAGDDAIAPEGRPGGARWLGMEYQDLTPALRSSHGIPRETAGVWVDDLVPSSPLFEQGVQPGDVITEVSGETVASAEEFDRALAAARSGSYVRLYVRRFAAQDARSFFAVVRVP
jgi:serine protease Do